MDSVQICNMALIRISKPTITTVAAGGSPQQNACWTLYEPTLKALLHEHRWSFARKHKALAVYAEDSDDYPGYYYAYEYPVDCLQPHEIYNPAGPDVMPVPYEIRTRIDGNAAVICTDQEDAELIYTMYLTHANQFPPLFISALVSRLAFELVPSLGARPAKQQMMWDIYNIELSKAMTFDSVGSFRDPDVDDFVDARS